MKKLLLMMLGVLMALPAMAVDFQYTYQGQTLTYTVLSETDRTCSTKNGSSYVAGNRVSGCLVIPETVLNGDVKYTVTSIGYRAFFDCSGLTAVTIPTSVTSIGKLAFSRCTGMAEV